MDSWWHYLNKICILLCLRPTYLWTFQVRWVNSVLLTKTVWTEFLSLGGCFRHSSVCKESACNAGDPGSIPGSGSSPGEGIGYPFQYSWASLVAQLVKNPPAMWETWVRSLSWEDLLEKGKATYASILAWRILWTTVHGVTETDRTEQLSLNFTSKILH